MRVSSIRVGSPARSRISLKSDMSSRRVTRRSAVCSDAASSCARPRISSVSSLRPPPWADNRGWQNTDRSEERCATCRRRPMTSVPTASPEPSDREIARRAERHRTLGCIQQPGKRLPAAGHAGSSGEISGVRRIPSRGVSPVSNSQAEVASPSWTFAPAAGAGHRTGHRHTAGGPPGRSPGSHRVRDDRVRHRRAPRHRTREFAPWTNA